MTDKVQETADQFVLVVKLLAALADEQVRWTKSVELLDGQTSVDGVIVFVQPVFAICVPSQCGSKLQLLEPRLRNAVDWIFLPADSCKQRKIRKILTKMSLSRAEHLFDQAIMR